MINGLSASLAACLLLGLHSNSAAQDIGATTYFRVGVGYSNVPGTTRLSAPINAAQLLSSPNPNASIIPRECFSGNGITHYTRTQDRSVPVANFTQFGNAISLFPVQGYGASFWCGEKYVEPKVYVEVSDDGKTWRILNSRNDQAFNHYLRRKIRDTFKDDDNLVVEDHRSGGVSVKANGQVSYIFSIRNNRFAVALRSEDRWSRDHFLTLASFSEYDSRPLEGASWAENASIIWLDEVDNEDFFKSLHSNWLTALNFHISSIEVDLQGTRNSLGDRPRAGWIRRIYDENFRKSSRR